MTSSNLIRFVQGFVYISVTGPAFEDLINRLTKEGIVIWDIRRRGTGAGECYISLPDFFRLRPMMRGTGCRVRILRRRGLPFWLKRLEGRKWFAAGAAAFVLGMYMLSSLVWSVEVSGNDSIPEETVLQAAQQAGIYPLQWKFRLASPGTLADRLAQALPNVSWVGVELKGTKVTIRVVEAAVPEERTPLSPRHLVSKADAVITKIIADRGVPQVDVNARVKQGDILISGILGEEEHRQVVAAEGDVRGLVWYEYRVQVPLMQRQETLTGKERTEWHLIVGSRALQLTGYFDDPYGSERTLAERNQLKFGRFVLPLGWMKEIHQETAVQEVQRTAEEAKQIGLSSARADLIAKLNGDVVIEQEKILQAYVDNGKVILQILFEAEIELAAERPILEEELAPKEDKPQ